MCRICTTIHAIPSIPHVVLLHVHRHRSKYACTVGFITFDSLDHVPLPIQAPHWLMDALALWLN